MHTTNTKTWNTCMPKDFKLYTEERNIQLPFSVMNLLSISWKKIKIKMKQSFWKLLWKVTSDTRPLTIIIVFFYWWSILAWPKISTFVLKMLCVKHCSLELWINMSVHAPWVHETSGLHAPPPPPPSMAYIFTAKSLYYLDKQLIHSFLLGLCDIYRKICHLQVV